MKWIQMILADCIRRGAVTVGIPGLDMDELRRVIHGRSEQLLCEALNVLCNEELTDREKVLEMQVLLL